MAEPELDIRRSTWLSLFPFLAPHKDRHGNPYKTTGWYCRYDGHKNMITGKPHSHARENARRNRKIKL